MPITTRLLLTKTFKFSFLTVLLAALFTGGLAGLNIWTYSRLTNETELGDLYFKVLPDSHFEVLFVQPDGQQHIYLLSGDDWQVDVRMIKWTSWLTLLGKDPIYRLDRISGRYRDLDKERNSASTIYSLNDNPGLDIWLLAREYKSWLPGIDAVYGSATYSPMHNGAHYRLFLSQTGLFSRPVSDTTEKTADFFF